MTLEAKSVIPALLGWYARSRRDLPWRHNVTPYRVWLSEIMLQQTTVPAVIPYFLKFTRDYPDIHALAAAPQEAVLRDWAGLGYYSRARNLHACAKLVSKSLGGTFPDTPEDLRKLPGIGPYTAGAIAALAFGRRASVVDGNVERVIARLCALETPLPAVKSEIRSIAETFFLDPANTDPAALPQAFMDLGASICTAATPLCAACPVAKNCKARKLGIAAQLPRRLKKADRPHRAGRVYVMTDRTGRVLLERRPDKGLLGGMAGLPTTDWLDGKTPPPPLAQFAADAVPETVRHVFTHFALTLTVHQGRMDDAPEGYYWDYPAHAGLPTVFKKALKLLQAA